MEPKPIIPKGYEQVLKISNSLARPETAPVNEKVKVYVGTYNQGRPSFVAQQLAAYQSPSEQHLSPNRHYNLSPERGMTRNDPSNVRSASFRSERAEYGSPLRNAPSRNASFFNERLSAYRSPTSSSVKTDNAFGFLQTRSVGTQLNRSASSLSAQSVNSLSPSSETQEKDGVFSGIKSFFQNLFSKYETKEDPTGKGQEDNFPQSFIKVDGNFKMPRARFDIPRDPSISTPTTSTLDPRSPALNLLAKVDPGGRHAQARREAQEIRENAFGQNRDPNVRNNER